VPAQEFKRFKKYYFSRPGAGNAPGLMMKAPLFFVTTAVFDDSLKGLMEMFQEV